MKTSTRLRRIAAQLEAGFGWNTGWYGFLKGNYKLGASDSFKKAVSCCTLGLLSRSLGLSIDDVYRSKHYEFVLRAIYALYNYEGSGAVSWNDQAGRTKQQVIAVFKAAATLAESEGK